MIKKIFRIYREESLEGIKRRLIIRFWLIKFIIWKFFKRQVVNSYYGVKLNANYDDATFKFYVTGSYGDDYWKHITDKMRPFVFLDIGANQGLYTLCAAMNKNCITCFSFEPVSKTFALLKKNVTVNDLSTKCHLINKAITNKSGFHDITIKANHSGVATMHPGNNLISETNNNTETIEAISYIELDNLIRNKDKVELIVKIDVEGFEMIVIKELLKTQVAKEITEIYFEVDERWIDYNDIEVLLKSNGYKFFSKTSTDTKHYDVYASKQ
jgi:FkbM family methyltransferase